MGDAFTAIVVSAAIAFAADEPSANPGTSVLTVSPDTVSMTWLFGQPDAVTLAVRNTSNAAVAVSTASALLIDSGSGRRVDRNGLLKAGAKIGPGALEDLVLTIPRPDYAGTYAGKLAIRYGQERLMVPLTVTTRGPTFGRYPLLPFVLFLMVLFVGVGLSFALENWFGEAANCGKPSSRWPWHVWKPRWRRRSRRSARGRSTRRRRRTC